MGDLSPRVGKRWGVSRTLFCGFPTCDGTVGGLAFSALQRTMPAPLQPHPGSRDLRDLVEAQAPHDALVAAVWVVPEGFRFDRRVDAWRSTRRGADRRRRLRRAGTAPTRRATHRPRPAAAGDATFAAAIPLPAVVLCPQTGCRRRNVVTRDLLTTLFARLAQELNAAALAIRDDPAVGESWLSVRLGLPIEQVAELANADQSFVPRLATVLPEWRLLDAARAGLPVQASDFFAVDLPAPWMAPHPDAGHVPSPAASAR